MSFAGTVTMDERDDVQRRVVLSAKGTEQKGKGTASAVVTARLESGSEEGETMVRMQADISLTGIAAQLSRGLLPQISRELTQRFADCLQASMTAERVSAGVVPETATGTPAVPHATTALDWPVIAKPVGGIGLGLSALQSMINALFRRLFQRPSKRDDGPSATTVRSPSARCAAASRPRTATPIRGREFRWPRNTSTMRGEASYHESARR